ncbi:IclR family transcriptional regulator [Demequina pelophila]|uniref:IclR family transcriptional regulator n=1 Tax=Demequina pelophila TaxID=1638984 RepID=UPI0007856610|nr:IclR family transcriptional regulator [Demequina pelophila]
MTDTIDVTTGEADAGEKRLVGSDRVLAVLIALAGRPEGATLDELSAAVASPKSTVHRALASLVRARLAAKESAGHYILGDEFLRLAFANHDARPEQARVQPALRALADTFGETAHYGVLDGVEVVYRAKVEPSAGAVRLTSTIGGRNPAHCTAIGKLLLSQRLEDDAAAQRFAREHQLAARTPHSIVDPYAFADELSLTRERGYALEEEESEIGINCIAVPAPLPPELGVEGAVSIAALKYRTPVSILEREVDRIRTILADEVRR